RRAPEPKGPGLGPTPSWNLPHFAGRMNQPAIPSNWGAGVFPGPRLSRALGAAGEGAWGVPVQGKKPLSALEIGLDLFLQILDRQRPGVLLAVDEQGRGRAHAELGRGPLARLFDVVEQLLIRQALLKALLRKARLLGELLERRQWLLHRPALLLAEQHLSHS